MKRETTLLTQKLENLKKRYHETHCLQCDLLQKHIRKEYREVKAKLIAPEGIIQSNNILNKSISNLQQSVAILGLSVMA